VSASRPPRRAAPAPLAAYLLHRWDWSETSLIVDLYTRERGRIVAAARGAKRPTSQLRPLLLPLQPLRITLGRTAAGDEAGAAEIVTLRAAEWGGGAPLVGGAALLAGLHVNELLLRLLPRHDPHPALFDAYAATLPVLAADEAGVQAALRAFELLLLRELGVLAELGAVTSTQQPLHDAGRYALHPELGVVAAEGRDDALVGGTLRAAQAALDAGAAATLPALQVLCRAAPAAWRTQLRALLHYHLGGAPLRTRTVVHDMQRLATPPR
jgi:DNA repair protein RecO (recombination protein O)